MPSRSRFDRARLGVLALGLVLLGGLASSACQSSNEAQAGERCFVTTDCAPGLVCIPSGENGSSTTCSANAGAIQQEPNRPGSPMTSSSGANPDPGDGGGSSGSSEEGGSSSGEPTDGGSSSGGSSSSSSSGGSSSSSSSSSSGEPDGGDDDDDAGP